MITFIDSEDVLGEFGIQNMLMPSSKSSLVKSFKKRVVRFDRKKFADSVKFVDCDEKFVVSRAVNVKDLEE